MSSTMKAFDKIREDCSNLSGIICIGLNQKDEICIVLSEPPKVTFPHTLYGVKIKVKLVRKVWF